MKKLKLNKEVLSSLDKSEMSEVKGGFTYGLSLGHICRNISPGHGGGGTKACWGRYTPGLTLPVIPSYEWDNYSTSPSSPSTTPSIKLPTQSLK